MGERGREAKGAFWLEPRADWAINKSDMMIAMLVFAGWAEKRGVCRGKDGREGWPVCAR